MPRPLTDSVVQVRPIDFNSAQAAIRPHVELNATQPYSANRADEVIVCISNVTHIIMRISVTSFLVLVLCCVS